MQGRATRVNIVIEITFVGDLTPETMNLGEGITCSRVERETEGVIETENDREEHHFTSRLSISKREMLGQAL